MNKFNTNMEMQGFLITVRQGLSYKSPCTRILWYFTLCYFVLSLVRLCDKNFYPRRITRVFTKARKGCNTR